MADKLGQPDIAKQLREHARQFSEPLKKRQQDTNFDTEFDLHGGVFPFALYVKSSGLSSREFKPADLAPTRKLDQVMLEQFAVCFFLLVMAAISLLTLMAQGHWFFQLRPAKSALLLLPPFKVFLRIFALGLLLPLTIYVVYSRWSGLAGREYNILYMGWRFAAELGVLMLIMIIIPWRLAQKYVRQRCVNLGIPLPPPGTMARSLAPIFAVSIIMVIAVTLPALTWQEKKLVREDTLIFMKNNEPCVTAVESRLARNLQHEMLHPEMTKGNRR